MAGILNKSVAADGVTAYQDHEDPRKFHYMPQRIDSVLGETIRDFGCQYYGIGAKPNWVHTTGSNWLDVSGGVVQGQAVPDITKSQQDAIIQEIGKIYEIDDPFLVPLILYDAEVSPVFAKGVQEVGGGGSVTFPTQVQFGNSFLFSVGSGNSLFTQLLARSTTGGQVTAPDLGINISGQLKLYGEPWKARIRADLKQVWSYVRDQVSGDVSLGWFNLGFGYDEIAQNLQKENIIQVEYIQGSGDEKFGRALLESTKQVFEAINAQIIKGEGMFRFEPNPDPQEPPNPEKSWGASLLPWQVNVNMAFIRNSFQQSIIYDETVSFTGFVDIPVNTGMGLAVLCGPLTKGMYYDATLGIDDCITQQKMAAFNARAQKEVAAKNAKLEEYADSLEHGRIELEVYEALVAMANNRVFTEHTSDGVNILSTEQAIANFDEEVRKYFGLTL